jgi:hypothetical protein
VLVAADVRPHGDSPNIAQRSLTPGFVVSARHTFTGPIRTIELDVDPHAPPNAAVDRA